MLLLSKKDFLKITKSIYKKNNKELVYDVCYHFSWDAINEHAEELVLEDKQKQQYFCNCCGELIPPKSQKKIAKLVKYLNKGGRNDRIMTRLYKDIDLYEWAVSAPGRIVENNACCNFISNALERSFGSEEVPIWNGK